MAQTQGEELLAVTDYFDTPATYVVKVGAEIVPIAVYPNGKGIGFGGYPTGEAFQAFMAAQFYKTLTLMDVDGSGINIQSRHPHVSIVQKVLLL